MTGRFVIPPLIADPPGPTRDVDQCDKCRFATPLLLPPSYLVGQSTPVIKKNEGSFRIPMSTTAAKFCVTLRMHAHPGCPLYIEITIFQINHTKAQFFNMAGGLGVLNHALTMERYILQNCMYCMCYTAT